VYTLKGGENLEKAVTMAENCCLTCSILLRCPDILEYKCKKYEKAEPDKKELSTRYIEILEKLTDNLKELELVEMGMKIAEKNTQISKAENEAATEQKPALSKRNKEIVKLIEQGKSIKEIAETLDIKPETVGVELEYLLKAGMIKAKPT
jgi:predicted ArsR family transcriptional regulator